MQDPRTSKLDPQPVPGHPHAVRQLAIQRAVVVFMPQMSEPRLARLYLTHRFQRLAE